MTQAIQDGVRLVTRPGLSTLARELRRLDGAMVKELGAVNKRTGRLFADEAQKEATRLGGVHAKAASSIRPAATSRAVKVVMSATKRHPYALVAWWGARRRSGWYAHPRYRASPPQHPPWVGNQWDPGDTGSYGSEPYGLGPAVRTNLDKVTDWWLDEIDRLFDEAWQTASRQSAGTPTFSAPGFTAGPTPGA